MQPDEIGLKYVKLRSHLIGTGVVDRGYVLDHVPNDFSERLVAPSHKLTGVEGVVEQKGLIPIGLLHHLHVKVYVFRWFYECGIYVQAGLGSGIGLQATVVNNHPRFVVRLAHSIRHFSKGCLLGEAFKYL